MAALVRGEELPGGRAVRPAHGEHDALSLPGQAQHVLCRERLLGARELVAQRGPIRRDRARAGRPRISPAAPAGRTARPDPAALRPRARNARPGSSSSSGARDAEIVRRRRPRPRQQNRRQQRQRRSPTHARALVRVSHRKKPTAAARDDDALARASRRSIDPAAGRRSPRDARASPRRPARAAAG